MVTTWPCFPQIGFTDVSSWTGRARKMDRGRTGLLSISETKYRILDHLPERVLERTDDEFRVDNLVDPVPILVAGVWKGLDVERLVPHLRDGRLVDPLGEIRQDKKLVGSRPPILMLRAFDFTVEPGKTYRYRARLVFWIPLEIRRKMEKPPPDFPGPWSEPTDGVKVR